MINVSAKQTTMQVGGIKGQDRFVLQAIRYSTLSEAKVIEEAALRTGLPKSTVRAAWEGCGEVISAWCVEGHSCPIPGIGHMRFGIRATAVEDVKDVSASLITARRVIFVPSVAIKDELAKTGISITCYDKNGLKISTVTSNDSDNIEDNDDDDTGTRGDGTDTGTPGGSGDGGLEM